MNWADYVIIGIIVLSVIISLWRGLLKEVLGLVVWAGALWLAFTYSDQAQALFENTITVPSARMAVGFALVFLAALIAGGMINFLLGKLIKSTGLSGTDRFFGMFFGLARACLLMVVLVMAAGFTPLPKDPWWQQSVLLPHFESLAGWASQFLPENMRQYFSTDASSAEADQPAGTSSSDPAKALIESGFEKVTGAAEQSGPVEDSIAPSAAEPNDELNSEPDNEQDSDPPEGPEGRSDTFSAESG